MKHGNPILMSQYFADRVATTERNWVKFTTLHCT